MIIRIMGEVQRDVPDAALSELNALDEVAERAVELGDETAFSSALDALLDAVRRHGGELADDVLLPSDLVLPPAHASVDEVRHLFDRSAGGEGLVPG
jgi:hypothetical protein